MTLDLADTVKALATRIYGLMPSYPWAHDSDALIKEYSQAFEQPIRELIAQATADALEAAAQRVLDLATLAPDIAAKAKEHDAALVADLAMLVRRLIKHCKDGDSAAAQALDYLHRKGLEGSPLRRETEAPERSPEVQEILNGLRKDDDIDILRKLEAENAALRSQQQEHDAKIRREAQEEYAEKHAEAHRQQILLLMGDKDKLKEQLRTIRREAYLRCADRAANTIAYRDNLLLMRDEFRKWANEADGGG